MRYPIWNSSIEDYETVCFSLEEAEQFIAQNPAIYHILTPVE